MTENIIKCCFCGKEDEYTYKNEIGSTKHERDINEGKHICWNCADYGEQNYFACNDCGQMYHQDSYGGENNEALEVCMDCFKGRCPPDGGWYK